MSTRHYQVITFDLDDTLWDMRPVLVNAEKAVRAWCDIHCPELYREHNNERLMALRTTTVAKRPELRHQISQLRIEVTREALEQCGYSAADARQLAEDAFDVFIEARHQVTLFEHAEQCLSALARHYRIGALTNGNACVYRVGLGDYFDFAFRAEELNAAKPAPEPFLAVLDHSGTRADQWIHVGDHWEHDVQGAQNIGADTIWVNSADALWPGAEKPSAQVRHIGEVVNAVEALERRRRSQH